MLSNGYILLCMYVDVDVDHNRIWLLTTLYFMLFGIKIIKSHKNSHHSTFNITANKHMVLYPPTLLN